ncbi:MAG: OmpA family protein [Desulfobulbaceae bacterium]|nr:OmpA family protein [Desulfobulbaceae bacterium]
MKCRPGGEKSSRGGAVPPLVGVAGRERVEVMEESNTSQWGGKPCAKIGAAPASGGDGSGVVAANGRPRDGGVPGPDDRLPGSSCPSVYGDAMADTFQRSRMPRAPDWSVAWSDLMMTMFIFFVVLYVYQSAHREPEFLGGQGKGSDMGSSMGTGSGGIGLLGEGGGGMGQGSGSVQSMARIYDLSKEVMREEFAEVTGVDLVPDKTVRIILAGDLLFDLGRAELKPKARASLDRVARVLQQTPYMVNVIGHTDPTPIHTPQFPTNWELSAVRASVVSRYLIEQQKLPARRFYVTGHAYHLPVAPNTSARNRAANRRVEIVITKEMPSALPAEPQ